MGKQMEGDNKQRRRAARKARESGAAPSEHGLTTGASKQRTHLAGDGDRRERLAAVQRGEAKQAGDDVPRPLRGKGRRKAPEVPPGPVGPAGS
jgi:hypothetical protein